MEESLDAKKFKKKSRRRYTNMQLFTQQVMRAWKPNPTIQSSMILVFIFS